ncbi:MAG: hypothetical protein ACFFCZ_22470 [Promethearchaeota archaeon]
MDEIVNSWRNVLKKVKQNPNTLDFQTDGLGEIYTSYYDLEQIFDLETLDVVKKRLDGYSELLKTINELRWLSESLVNDSVEHWKEKREENLKQATTIYNMLRDDVSFLKNQLLSIKQTELIEKQMKTSSRVLKIAIIALVISLIFGLITVYPTLKTFLGLI